MRPLRRRRRLSAAAGVSLAALLSLAAIHAFGSALAWTGDEQRYTYYGAALYTTGRLTMTDEEWSRFLLRFGLPPVSRSEIAVDQPRVTHSPAHVTLASPAIGLFGVDGGRWLQLAAAGAAFAAVLRLLAGHVPPGAAAAATAFAFLSLPIQPYARLLYSEIWLMLAFALAWTNVHRPQTSAWSVALALGPMLALPFLHIRASTIAAALFVIWTARLLRDPDLRPRRTALLLGTFAAAGAAAMLFAAYQVALFGSVTGSAGVAEDLRLDRLVYRLGVQLFEFRHGLLANNPAALLGFVGLLRGAAGGQRLAREGLFLFAMYLPFVAGAASESMPARFWVAIMPVIVAGMSLWLAQARSVWQWLPAIPLIVASMAVSVLLAVRPNLFLENRQASFTYEYLYEQGSVPVYFAPFLPWETYGLLSANDAINQQITYAALLLAVTFAACLTLGLARSRPLRTGANASAVVLMAAGCLVFSLSPVPPAEWATRVAARPDGRHELTIVFRRRLEPRVLRFGEPRLIWFPPEYPGEFSVDALEGGTWRHVQTVPTTPILAIRSRVRAEALRVVEGTPTDGRWTRSPVTVLD